MSAPTTERPAAHPWRIAANVWLEPQPPRIDESERWETPLTGPHPCSVHLAKMLNGAWRATVHDYVAYNDKPLHALLEAQVRVCDALAQLHSRVWHMDFEVFAVKGEP